MKLRVASAFAFSAVLLTARPSSADVSSWYSLSGGASLVSQGHTSGGTELVPSGLFELDAGVGLPAKGPVVVGGIFHFAGHFAVGADLGGALRLTTRGYTRGDFGLGLDLGAAYRVATHGGAMGTARILCGAPYGLFVGLGAAYGEGSVFTGSLALGFDFARLSIHRSRGTKALPSPLHAN